MKCRFNLITIGVLMLFSALPIVSNAKSLKLKNVRTEYKDNPIGIGETQPRFSWEIVAGDERNIYQKAYHIRCARSIADLKKNRNLLWDTGWIDSQQSNQLRYSGKELASGGRVYWQVSVKTNKLGTAWSEPNFFEIGMLSNSEWKAKWIESGVAEDVNKSTPAPYLRKEFSAAKKIKKATVYITARGLYEFSLNGDKVSEDLFTPGWTSYEKRMQYQTYDVTSQLKPGDNAIGIILGDGWWRSYFGWEGKKNLYGEKTALLFQLKVEYVDGSSELICSDDSWKSSIGAILESDIYNGEKYDARLEQDGWNTVGFDDSKWESVVVKSFGYDNIVSSDGNPVQIIKRIKPIKKITTPKGEVVFDFGQNLVGWVNLKLEGAAGTTIILNHGEVLDKDGNFYDANLRLADAEDRYTFKGKGVEDYQPKFTFHGFQFLKVSGYTGDITVDDLEACVVHSAMKPIGNFECSDTLINQLQSNIQWSLIDNTLDVPTDCPQRDERMGWTGDAQVIAPTANFNFETVSFFSKWLQDLSVDQKENGSVPWVVPNVIVDGAGTGWSDGYGATAWSDAAVIIPWSIYQAYGDKAILEQQYESMKGWEEYMIDASGDNYIFSKGFHFGDWLSFAEYFSYNYNAPDYGYAGANTDKELVATAYYYYTTGLMQQIAEILDKDADAKRYSALLPKIKDAFNKEFVTATGRTVSGTQTSYILPLCFGILEQDMVDIVAKRLADDVNYFGHLTTGFVGTPLLCKALSNYGYPDVAYKLLFNKRYPSWLYPVTMGATTIWERWDCIKPDGTFQTVGMNSFNHYAYGAVGQWLYETVAGLQIDPKNPGYKNFIVNPISTDSLDYATATHNSMYGEIVSGWKREGDKFTMEVKVPANSSAIVYLPTDDISKVTESGTKLSKVKDIKIEERNEKIVVELGSGSYVFEINKDII